MAPKIALAILASFAAIGASAQGITDSAIVGEDMEISSSSAHVTAGEVRDLIKGSENVADDIRTLADPQRVSIVELGERRRALTNDIEAVLRENEARLVDLRNAVQINAPIVEVLNQRNIGVPEIVAVTMPSEDEVVIYAFSGS